MNPEDFIRPVFFPPLKKVENGSVKMCVGVSSAISEKRYLKSDNGLGCLKAYSVSLSKCNKEKIEIGVIETEDSITIYYKWKDYDIHEDNLEWNMVD